MPHPTEFGEGHKMQFGMPTLLETNTFESCAALCRELGLGFVELNMNLPQYQLDAIDVSYFKRIAAQYGIGCTIHLDENLNVSDFNPYIAEGYRRTVRETIGICKTLEIPILTMHFPRGVYFTLPEGKTYLFSAYRHRYLESILDFRVMCEEAIGDSGIMICIENSNGFLPFQKEAICLLLESPVFGLTYDIGHNHSCGGLDEPFIMQNKGKLRHMHVHDAQDGKDHLALGSGALELNAYLALAEATGCRVGLETKTAEGLKQSQRWVRKNGFMA